MKDLTIKQKIFVAECMVDFFLREEDWVGKTLMAIQTAQQVGDTAHGLANDVRAVKNWVNKKKKERELKKKQQSIAKA